MYLGLTSCDRFLGTFLPHLFSLVQLSRSLDSGCRCDLHRYPNCLRYDLEAKLKHRRGQSPFETTTKVQNSGLRLKLCASTFYLHVKSVHVKSVHQAESAFGPDTVRLAKFSTWRNYNIVDFGDQLRIKRYHCSSWCSLQMLRNVLWIPLQ